MLAYLRGPWAQLEGLEHRVGASLGLFAGVTVPGWRDHERIAWQLQRVGELPARHLRQRPGAHVSRRPALLEGGIAVQVHGWIDNCAELAAELGCPPDDQALIYGHAVRAWGDGADERIHGGYCAVYDDPAGAGPAFGKVTTLRAAAVLHDRTRRSGCRLGPARDRGDGASPRNQPGNGLSTASAQPLRRGGSPSRAATRFPMAPWFTSLLASGRACAFMMH